MDTTSYSYAANMNQNVRTTDNVTFANITGNTIYAGGGTTYYINGGTSALSSLSLGSTLTISSIGITQYNVRDLQIKGTGGSDIGLLGYGSSDQFGFQLYGDGGGNYGFLGTAWGSWDLRKNIGNGNLYMNNNSTYYLNTNGTSNIYGLVLLTTTTLTYFPL
jgi:hypothetical protein